MAACWVASLPRRPSTLRLILSKLQYRAMARFAFATGTSTASATIGGRSRATTLEQRPWVTGSAVASSCAFPRNSPSRPEHNAKRAIWQRTRERRGSDQGASNHFSHSAGSVRITGIALGWITAISSLGADVRDPNSSAHTGLSFTFRTDVHVAKRPAKKSSGRPRPTVASSQRCIQRCMSRSRFSKPRSGISTFDADERHGRRSVSAAGSACPLCLAGFAHGHDMFLRACFCASPCRMLSRLRRPEPDRSSQGSR